LSRFESYARKLEYVARLALAGKPLGPEPEIQSLLNGGAAAELEKALGPAMRKRLGAFFTGHGLRDGLFSGGSSTGTGQFYWDPACGAGDLLIAASAHLPIARTLEKTLSTWSARLFGTDIEYDFIRAARARLIIAAATRGARPTARRKPSVVNLFPGLRVADSLRQSPPAPLTHVLLNPPFGKARAPRGCTWGSGKVSRAAVFLARCISTSPPGTRVSAILPDVLRSGARYRRWREWIDARAQVSRIEVCGRFHKCADVDVFIVDLVVRPPLTRAAIVGVGWTRPNHIRSQTLGDRFHVNVGPVVPHRHAISGPVRRYLIASDARAGSEVHRIPRRRRFEGSVFSPPFLAIRRTSSPSDRARVVVTLVRGKKPVAVENHLIVLSPKRDGIRECRRAWNVLNDPKTVLFIDQRIRCRHLTVEAVKEIPW
jgi:hypothetical protein